MQQYKHYLTLLTLAMGLAACATATPTRFYTLSNIGHLNESEHSQINATHIDLRPVIVPERLKRTQIVLNTANSAALTMLESERWASAFNDELHDAIAAGLNQGMQNETPVSNTPKSYRVTVELHQLEALKGQGISSAFSYIITRLDAAMAEKANTCQIQLVEPVGNTTNAIVQGLQKMVNTLSTRIANNINQLNVGQSSLCQ